jgi:hypothetical protein
MPAISNKSIVDKLFIKPGKCVVLIDAPTEYEKLIRKSAPDADISISASATKPADIIQVFVKSADELTQKLPTLKKHLKSDGALWVAYYKGTAKVKTDINRDRIAEYATSIGMEGVAIISIDDDWSALRLKIVG